MTSKMTQLENTIKMLQEIIKQQQETINKLTAAQKPASPFTWTLGSVPIPASFTALRVKPMAAEPSTPPAMSFTPAPEQKKIRPPPAKLRRRKAPESDTETDSAMGENSSGDSQTSSDAGINYAVRIRKMNKRLDWHEREIKVLNEKVTHLDERVSRLEVRVEKGFAETKQSIEELKQLIMGLASKIGHDNQEQQQGPTTKHG